MHRTVVMVKLACGVTTALHFILLRNYCGRCVCGGGGGGRSGDLVSFKATNSPLIYISVKTIHEIRLKQKT
jgi:hypothetical protein